MIKITLSEVFLASVQVLDLYGWLGTYKDKKKKKKKGFFLKRPRSA